ncbi:AT-hook-containing transcription factor [Python bivittatus]|uniref:AT-hook-containing transcription factor n=1 Tax=Python bivittatus TaxID=176946 RepID=A0A9F5MT68_PYTBI|nr:AT-hook-containing transcription factor [Python bivittatus]
MARRGSNGFRGQQHKEKESEEDAELEGRRYGATQIGEGNLAGNLGCWNLSSSQEILEDDELLGELKDYQHLLQEDEHGFDLSELQDLECAGDVNAASPLPEDEGSPKDLGLRSYWQPDKMHEEGSTERPEKPRGTWGIGSQEDVYPELSFEGQFGSDFSPSPEALQDPLALYKCSFVSDNVDDELSESSNFSPSPCGPPPTCAQLEIEPRSLGGDGLDFPEDRKLSLESGRSLESHRLSSLASSLQYSQRLLDFQSLEDLQNSPSMDAEAFPELSWMENTGQPLEKEPPAETVQITQQHASNASKTEERLLDSRKVTQTPRAQRRVGCRLEERTQKLKADVPRGLLPKGTRQSRSLSPQRSTSQKKSGHLALKEPNRESHSTPGARDITQYGRGQLNYPLPDLSKVEPRVKFPKDPQSYHPPPGKMSPASSKKVRKPVIFKSPAEIVREVLLSSGEGSPQKCPAPTVSVIPEELKSPRQATELVHQLQEDYHKLLTKYAEAENTIDRLRLSAKVRLYSDPPKPSQAVETGRLSEASKVVTFSIPQIRTAEIASKSNRDASKGAQGEGFPGQLGQPSSLSDSTGTAASRTNSPISTKTPFLGDHLTQLLAAQAGKFQTQMEFLEELIQMDRLEALDQLKGFARLKEAQQALERAYLQARNKYQQLQNQKEPVETLGEFDPNRSVEGNIFHLGMRLEALKERIEQSALNEWVAPDSSPLVVPSHPCFPAQLSEEQVGSPTPSLQAPVPAVCMPYPEASTPKRSFAQVQLEGDFSSISDGTAEEEGDFLELPQPCKHQEEENFDHLLDQCSSFKSLPEALSHKHNASSEELGSAATAAAGTKAGSLQKSSAANKKTPTTSKELQQDVVPEVPVRKVQQPASQIRHVSSIQAEAALHESPESNSPMVVGPRMSSRRQQAPFSSHSSTASVVGSMASESAPPNISQKMNTTFCEDLRILSPETDSGFVGSETSRASPLAQMAKHQSSKRRSHSIQRPSPILDSPPCSPSSNKVPAAMTWLRPDKSLGQVRPQGERSQHTSAKRNPFQQNSPCRWTNEMEPDSNENSPTDSETETPHGRNAPSSCPTSLNLAQTHHNFLDSRLERDQAIAALQHEVSQLRQSLEETLHRHSSSPHLSRVQASARLSPSVTPAGTSGKSMVEPDQSFLATEPKGRTQKPSLAEDRSQLDFNPSGSDDAPSKSRNRRHHAASKPKPSKQSTVRGSYTGTWYPTSTPESQEPKTLQVSALCLRCRNVKMQHGEAAASHADDTETKGHHSPRDGSRPPKQSAAEERLCHSCKDSANSRSKDTAGAGDRKENAPDERPTTQPKVNQQPKQTGLWYLAVPSAATSVNYIPAIPLAPYPLSSVIYSPPLGTTSICSSIALPGYDFGRQQATQWEASRQHPRDPQCCPRTFSCTSLEDLSWPLSRAVEAARDMKFTTQQMSKSLSWALRKARSPRASRLF